MNDDKGLEVSKKMTAAHAARGLPAGVEDVALISGHSCAAIGAVSISWWLEEVRAGRAPRPAIQQPRFTRWRLLEVRAFWLERVAHADAAKAEALISNATAASAAAQRKRLAAAAAR
jgi:hypothetical protein